MHDNQSLSYGLLRVQQLGLPVVATVHHPIHIDRDLELAAAHSSWERLRLRRWYSFLWMQGIVSRRLPLLISVSESSARATQRAFRVPRYRIRTVFNGVDSEAFRAPSHARRRASRVVVVSSAGTPIKGLAHLYGAVERLVHRRPVEALIVGNPKDRQRTGADLRRRRIEGQVRFLGKLDHEALVEAYSTATVAVLPSLYEGFGLPAAEAMACQAPVVAYAAGALPEIIGTDGEAGRLVSIGDEEALADAIDGLLDDPAAAARMGRPGGGHSFDAFHRGASLVVALDLDGEALGTTLRMLGGMRKQGEAAGSYVVVRGDGNRLPLPDESFERLICAETLVHIPSDRAVIAELARVLRPGGRLAVSVPRRYPERPCWALSREYRETPGGHVRIYRASQPVRAI